MRLQQAYQRFLSFIAIIVSFRSVSVLIVVAVACPAQAGSDGWYYTKGGYVVATSRALFERSMDLLGSGDHYAIQAFLNQTRGAFIIKAGTRVYLEEATMSGLVRIRPEGFTISVWTVAEAINRGGP